MLCIEPILKVLIGTMLDFPVRRPLYLLEALVRRPLYKLDKFAQVTYLAHFL